MSIDAQRLKEETTRLSEKDGLSFLNHPERVKGVKDHFGFYPQSNEETTRVIELLKHEDRESPVLSYLNKIYVSQRKVHADASKALRSIVRGFEEYAGNAVNEMYCMELFIDQLSGLDPNSRTGFMTLFPIEDWQFDTTQIATFSAMTRYLETDHFAENETQDRHEMRQLIDYTSGDERQARIVESLGELRASSLKKVAVSVRDNQDNRFTYWAEQLEASKKHFFAREAATIALQELMYINR